MALGPIFNNDSSLQRLLAHISMKIISCSFQSLSSYFPIIYSILAIKYLARLYCICLVSSNLDTNQIDDVDFEWMHAQHNFPQWIQMKYEILRKNQTNIDDLVRSGIDNDCQVKKQNEPFVQME